MRVVQCFLGSIARQALVCKEALPRRSSAELGELGAAGPHEGLAELGGNEAGPHRTYSRGNGIHQLRFFNHGFRALCYIELSTSQVPRPPLNVPGVATWLTEQVPVRQAERSWLLVGRGRAQAAWPPPSALPNSSEP
jgi:hypothetical protein